MEDINSSELNPSQEVVEEIQQQQHEETPTIVNENLNETENILAEQVDSNNNNLENKIEIDVPIQSSEQETTHNQFDEPMDTTELTESVPAVDLTQGVEQENIPAVSPNHQQILDNSLNLDDATCKSVDIASSNQQHELTSAKIEPSSDTLSKNDLDHLDDNSNLDDQATDQLLKDLDDSTVAACLSGRLQDDQKGLDDELGSGLLNSTNLPPGYENANNLYTFRKTEWDVKKMENYVRLTFGDSTAMEKMEPPMLNNYLKSFFEHAKKSDGMDYEPESLIGFMNSYERYLKTKNYPESLLRSDAFKESRTILKNKRELVRSIGRLIRTKSKDTCYILQFHRNLLKEKSLLNRDNPDGLLAEVYLNNTIYFGEYLKEDKAWRGNLNLVWGDILLERDPDNGLEYLTLSISVKRSSSSKNNAANSSASAQQQKEQHAAAPQTPKTINRIKTGTQTSKLRAAATSTTTSSSSAHELCSPRVYARQPANMCPIEAYKLFKARRPNTCLDRESPFYLAPNSKSKFTSKVWYKALAMSCQRLDALFYCLFKKANLNIHNLASMSEAEQQQIIAQAATASQANNDVVVWKANKPIVNQPQETDNPHHGTGSGHHHHHKEPKERHGRHNKTINQLNNANNNQNSQAYQNQHHLQQQQHHHVVQQNSIIATVPVQVQVQVQIQVQPPQKQQHMVVNDAYTNSSIQLLV
jgi:hypothetical protein